ncbi:MAG: hypothetical protein AB2689_06010 [Candidatus Thiodiazotropha taylori]
MPLRILKLIISLTLIISIVSCESFKASPVTDSGDKGTQYGKAYFPLFKEKEPSGYGMYTYVLMGVTLDDTDINKRRDRLEKILNHIVKYKKNRLISEKEKSYYNLFIYPSIRQQRRVDANMIMQYDFDRSHETIDEVLKLLRNPKFIQEEVRSKESQSLIETAIEMLLTKDGPFLISFKYPINLLNKQDDKIFFIADLSDSQPSIMTTVVDEYMKSLEKVDSEIKIFESLKLRILNRLVEVTYVTQDVVVELLLIKKAVSDLISP